MKGPLKTIFYLLGAFALMMLFAWIFVDIFLYVVIAVVVSSILRPLMRYLSNAQFMNIRIPKLMAVASSFLILISVIVLFVLLFIPLITEQIEVLATVNYEQLYSSITGPIINLEDFFIKQNLTEEKPGFIVNSIRDTLRDYGSNIKIGNMLNDIISFTGKLFVGVLAVTFISFFLLYEMGSIRNKLISFIPNKYFEVTIAAYNKIERLLSNYLVGLLLQMFVVFAMSAIGLAIIGVKYALTIALFAAIANLIPYLGPVLGASFGYIVALSTDPEVLLSGDVFVLLLKIVVAFALVQFVDNIVLQPVIFSKSVKAHPLEIFIIIFVGATVAGIPGMIAAIPVYTILRVSLSELYDGYNSYRIFKIQKSTV